MNKKHILIVGIGFFLMATICFMEYNQSPSNSFNINLGKDGDNDVLGENYQKIAATANYTLDFDTTWGGSNYDYANDIALDGAGNIYITGYTFSFGAGASDAFIAKYDSAGTSLLNITWGGGNSECGNGIALDGAGNIYITGTTYSFGAGLADAFIAKYDSAGTLLLNITWGGSYYDSATGITLDGAGNIYITGYTSSFGAGGDVFIAKYDSAGTSLLNITWGGSNDDSGNDIVLDGAGNIYITGYINMITEGDPEDAFIAKYDSAGTSLLNITWGGSNDDYGNDIALDGAGNIYITGGTTSFGAGGPDAFIAKYKRTIDDSTDAGIPGPTILLIGIISALSIGMILKRLFQTNKLRRI